MIRVRGFEIAGCQASGLETRLVEVYGLLQLLPFKGKSGP